MGKRPTIKDLADAAGVSVSTVNRVINDAASVKESTRNLVLDSAQDIGFYGLGSIEHSVRISRETHRLGVLLLHEGRQFYNMLGEAISAAAAANPDANIKLLLRYADDLSPESTARHIVELADACESIALVAAQHPLVAEAIDSVMEKGVPVSALIGPLNAKGHVGFVGLENWKVGRTAAWAFDKICKQPGKIGILVGNHRYRNQDLNESGFRSYFREHGAGFTLLEPLSTFESAAVAREMTENLLTEHPNLCGLFISGGGITGAIAALRARPMSKGFVAVGYELFEPTRTALLDGVLTMVISHPLKRFATEIINAMIRAKKAGPEAGAQRVNVDFEIYTSENV